MPCRPLDEPPYQCFMCTFVGGESLSLRKHIERDHSRSNYFWCKWCGKASSCLDEHLNHLELEQCTDTFEHPCGFEGCTYSDHHPSTFISHLKIAHKGKTLIPCAYCRRLFTLPPCLISHIQNDCCNRPTSSSSPKTLPKSTKDDEAPSSSNSQDPAVSSSTSKPPAKKTDESSKTKKKGTPSPEKRKNKSKNPDDFSTVKPAWNPFGLNKDFISANDSDSTGSTLSTENSKSSTNSSSQKRKSTGIWSRRPMKRIRPSDNESSESEFLMKGHTYNTWADWIQKMQKYKSADDVEVFLKKERAEHFFKCMQPSCTHSSHNNMDFTLHLYGHHKGQKPKCFYCFSTFDYTEMLIKHMVTRHIERRWQCNTCLYRASSKTHIKEHQRIFHAGEDVQIVHCKRAEVGGLEEGCTRNLKTRTPCSYNCRVLGCNFSTLITVDFRDHLLEKHKNVNYFTCCYCEFETTKLEQLVSHYRRHNMHHYECYYCTFGSELPDDVLTHVCINHADNQMKVLSRSNESAPDLVHPDSVKNSSSNCNLSEQGGSLDHQSSNGERLSSGQGSSPVKRNESSNDGDVHKNEKDARVKWSSSGSSKQSPGKSSTSSKVSKTGESSAEKGEKSPENTLSCEYCDKIYTYEKAFKNHNKTAHGVNMTDNYVCSLCDFRSFALSRVITHAQLLHPGQTCNVVDLSQKSQKKNSAKGKKETKPQFICVFCDVIFESELYLTDHLYLELGYQKFSCKLCDFRHCKRNEVVKHSKVKHPKVLPHVVSNEKQNYEDWISSYVQVQTNKPSDEACVPMLCSEQSGLIDKQCKMCKKQFSSLDLLKYHVFQHLQYSPHQCTLCKQKFINLAEAEDHSKSVHHTTKRSTKLSYKPIDKIEQWLAKLLNIPDCASQDTKTKKSEKKRRFPTIENDVLDESTAETSGVIEDIMEARARVENGNTSPKPPNITAHETIGAKDNPSVSRKHAEQDDINTHPPTLSNEGDSSIKCHRPRSEDKPAECNEETPSNDETRRNVSSPVRFSSPFDDDDDDDSSSDDYELPDIVETPSNKYDDDDEVDSFKEPQLGEKSPLGCGSAEGETRLINVEYASDATMTANAPHTPMKQTARKSFPLVTNIDSLLDVSNVKLSGNMCARQTARKSCARSSFNPTDTTEEAGCSHGMRFKATARKSTSKPARNLIKTVETYKRRYVVGDEEEETLDLTNVFYVPRKMPDLKIYSHLFPSFFEKSEVVLGDLREIL